MTTVGITGSTGFIGKSLIPFLAAKSSFRLRCLVRHAPDWANNFGEKIELIRGDLQSAFDCGEFVQGLDAVIHLASAGTPLTAGRSLPGDVALSLTPTLNLLQAIKDKSPAARIVFASSGGQVYGRSESQRPWNEDSPCEPVSIYGIHKLTCEHYLRLLAEESGIRSTILRIGNVYGGILPPERLQGFIGVAIHELSHGRPVRLIGDAMNVRDYVHLDDVCAAFEMALSRTGSCEVLNIGSGQGISVEDILHFLSKIAGREIPTLRLPPVSAAASLIPWNVLNCTRAAKVGWKTTVSFEDGIKRLLSAANWP